MTPTKKKKAKAAKARVLCCRYWTKLQAEQRGEWPWQVMHQLAHSRTTFTVPTLADLARCDDRRAGELLRSAEQLGWIWRPAEGIWVGQLGPQR